MKIIVSCSLTSYEASVPAVPRLAAPAAPSEAPSPATAVGLAVVTRSEATGEPEGWKRETP